MVNGFDHDYTPLAIEAQPKRLCAESHTRAPGEPVQVRGGYQYAGGSGSRGLWNLDKRNIMPRFGLAIS